MCFNWANNRLSQGHIFHILSNWCVLAAAVKALSFISVLKRKIFTGKRRMHKPEEPLPFPFHVRIFVIIPFSTAFCYCLLASFSQQHQQPERRRLPEKQQKCFGKKLLNILAFNQRICCYLTPSSSSFFLSVTSENVFITLCACANKKKKNVKEKSENDLRDRNNFSLFILFVFLLSCEFVFHEIFFNTFILIRNISRISQISNITIF